MGQPQGEEGWDVEGMVMTRGTEGVDSWGVGVKGEGRGAVECLSTSVAMGF